MKFDCLLAICDVDICGLFDFVLLDYVVYDLVGDLFLCVCCGYLVFGWFCWLIVLLFCLIWFSLSLDWLFLVVCLVCLWTVYCGFNWILLVVQLFDLLGVFGLLF